VSGFRILLVSGSLRDGSTNSALLRTAAVAAPDGIETTLYGGMRDLPHFDPGDDPADGSPPAAVAQMRAVIAAHDAILFCTPEYAGGLPGSFKNLLDWTVGGGETYGMAVAWVNVSGPAAPQGGAGAIAGLEATLGYTGSKLVADACRRIPVSRDDVGADGLIADPTVREQVAGALRALADAAAA
jgi:chromate reductase, NAD(P)H dehydrogenase (quinone)